MKRILSSLVLAWLLATPMFAATPLQGTCVATLKIAATGHKFEGAVTSEVFQVTFSEVQGKTLADFTVEASMSKLTTFHDKRDREMREHFKADAHPKLSGQVKGFDWATLAAASAAKPVEIPVTFSFGGGSAPIKAAVTRFEAKADGSVQMDASFTVIQTSLGYKRIRMMGLMTVKDEVPVSARFTLQPVSP